MTGFTNIEFHRAGYGMLPDVRDKDPGAPICFPRTVDGRILTGHCDCRERRKTENCGHLSSLIQIVSDIRKMNKGRHWEAIYVESLWYRLAQLLSEGDAVLCPDVRVGQIQRNSACAFHSSRGTLLATILDSSPSMPRFLQRSGMLPHASRFQDRASLLQRLASWLRSDEEKKMNEYGVLTRRQAAEQSFWGRFAYHCFREYATDCIFHPAVEESSGDFILKCASCNGRHLFELSIPRRQVRKILALLAGEFPDQKDLAIHPVPLRSRFLVSQKTKLDLEVRPAIQALQATGESKFYQGEDFAKFRYCDLVYLRELNILAEMEAVGSGRKFTAPIAMRLERSRLPAFLDEHRKAIEEGALVLDEPLRHLSILRDCNRVEIIPDAIERSWYWLSIRYGFGTDSVSLAEVIEARRQGQSYIPAKGGWIDLNSSSFGALDMIERRESLTFKGEMVQLSPLELLRLMATSGRPVSVEEGNRPADLIKRLLAFAPAAPLGNVKGMSALRPYQVLGLDWLRFLWENQLSGLLCDDMGLGKTHQAMALMVWLKEQVKIKDRFLVVCPTTVISHWHNKIQEHAPKLKPVVYHGGQRDLESAMKQARLLLTSYGVLRNDITHLSEMRFSVVVFDEIQNLKNRETLSYQAACMLQARMRIGLTGTPIANSLADLKALFDLVLPGYLGCDEEFEAWHAEALQDRPSATATQSLRKWIAPFVLRRLKSAVLAELPEKIEDLRTCELSEMQVKLYREALSTKGADLLAQLRSDARQLPYIHIFALLNLLKRICDHPALALNEVQDYQSYESGKWELFQELLFESLDSGQKVVVFSQYLGMISMMERLLANLNIGFVTLTGASANRGEIVRRFNEDVDCRVFLGSLKAGGTGIDLVGGSVVIHYDRWWNAAREDQATDRVHRIGQRRAVQIFKLVSAGTLEEKISAIIERKRKLMDSVVQADDPHLGKVFSRSELIELLRPL